MKNQKQVSANELKETLKLAIQKEIEKLPETLANTEPKERLKVLCKLLTFVFPKAETETPTPGDW